MVLTVSFVLSPVIGLLVTVASVMRSIIARLMPASRHQDHTTSPSASQRIRLMRRPRPSLPAPNVRDDRETPLVRARDARKMRLIWDRAQCDTPAAHWHDGQISRLR
jgi:hypothetical protein